LGIGDINTVEELAHLKSVVPASVFADGYAVLNAEDELVAAMAARVKGQVAYFSLDPDQPTVKSHIAEGGLAAIYENGYLSIVRGDWTLRIEEAVNMPITLGGKARFMIQNALAASLAAFAQGVKIDEIRAGLMSFVASVDQTPGRMNLFNLGKFHVLLDYAHNPAGYKAIADFVNTWGRERIGVIGAPGDRRDADIEELGQLSVSMFNRIIIKEDADRRGREPNAVATLIQKGIEAINPDINHEIILDEDTAIATALDQASEGALVVIFPEKVDSAIKIIQSRQGTTT
jgi:cyanophycin synthetase